MKGKLYGVGVGPGNPELMTLQAVRIIRECEVIFAPGKNPRETVAWKIAVGAVPELAKKTAVGIEMPMTRDGEKLEAAHRKAEETICRVLGEGKNGAFLTLGDPCVYSTYLYIHHSVQDAGFEAEIINGIPSFLAVAARLGEGLAENSVPIHILPASWHKEEDVKLDGTRIFMKAGSQMTRLREDLIRQGCRVQAVERCGMEGERIYRSAEEIPEEMGYYSIVIAKEREE